mmetsp:Transcript_22927/g.52524  ORF Transcript_22927/g.52524 Transcript_22927/m.52524 type:complete len:482 (-) Transcript_22927:84-1529(-)
MSAALGILLLLLHGYPVDSQQTLTTVTLSTKQKLQAPVLGRGYSMNTGEYSNICLIVNPYEDIMDGSFDYDYTYVEIIDEESSSADFKDSGSKQSSGWFKKTTTSSFKIHRTQKNTEKLHFIAITSSINKYYLGIDESKSELTNGASNFLRKDMLIQFFSSCGPTYVRSIRRESELAALFEMKSSSDEMTFKEERFKNGNKVKDVNSSRSMSREKLTITLRGFGLDFNDLNDKDLLVNSIQGFQSVMDYSFQSMMNPLVGTVVSLEAIPWTAHLKFQTLVRLDAVAGQRDGLTVSPTVRKFFLIQNAYFLARLDKRIKEMFLSVNILIGCLNKLLLMCPSENQSDLRNRACVKPFQGNCPVKTVFGLKNELLGRRLGTYLFQRQTNYVRDYMNNFYVPCVDEMQAEAFGIQEGNMQVEHWTRMDNCNIPNCLSPNAVWDGGQCTANFDITEGTALSIRMFCLPKLESEVFMDVFTEHRKPE